MDVHGTVVPVGTIARVLEIILCSTRAEACTSQNCVNDSTGQRIKQLCIIVLFACMIQ